MHTDNLPIESALGSAGLNNSEQTHPTDPHSSAPTLMPSGAASDPQWTTITNKDLTLTLFLETSTLVPDLNVCPSDGVASSDPGVTVTEPSA